VRELTGASADEAREFLAIGMLLTVLGAMQLLGPDAVPAEGWMTELVEPLDLKMAMRKAAPDLD